MFTDKQIEEFKNAKPFPNLVIDGVLDEVFLDRISKEVANLYEDGKWFVYNNPLEKKHAREDLPPQLARLAAYWQKPEFVAQLSKLVGVELKPNPDLRGAGLHRISTGGKLDLHLDHNQYQGMERKLNIIFWFHDVDWKSKWNGHLELWSEKNGQPLKCVKKILPKRNRMAIFECSEKSIHGHPTPLKCPADVFRTSLALYYYTDDVSDAEPRNRVRFLKHPADEDDPKLDWLRKDRENPQNNPYRVDRDQL